MEHFRKPILFEKLLMIIAIVVLFVGITYILQVYNTEIHTGPGGNFWVVISLFLSLGTLFLMFILSGTKVDVKEELAELLRGHMRETILLKEITKDQVQEIKLLNKSTQEQTEEDQLFREQLKNDIKKIKILKKDVKYKEEKLKNISE